MLVVQISNIIHLIDLLKTLKCTDFLGVIFSILKINSIEKDVNLMNIQTHRECRMVELCSDVHHAVAAFCFAFAFLFPPPLPPLPFLFLRSESP